MSANAVGKLKKALLSLLVPFLFINFVVAVAPIKQSFEFDPDEGVNLIKVLLYSDGFSLYTEIWSDQPPVFTSILSGWFLLFGQSIFAARILVLLFSALLIWCFYQTLRVHLGAFRALIGTLLLISSRKFIQLSVSVMIGIPSLALAMLSIYTLSLYKQKPRSYLLLVSGFSLALSLQTKFFTVFLIPITLFYLLDLRFTKRQILHQQKSALFWLLIALGFYVLIGFEFNAFEYQQLIQSHLQQSVNTGFENYDSFSVLYWMLRHDYDIVILALVGIAVVLVNKQRQGIFPLIWLATAAALLFTHQPVWYHHYSLLSIPLSWLAAYGSTPAIAFFQQGWLSVKSFPFKQLFAGLTAILLCVSLVNINFKVRAATESLHVREAHHDPHIVNLLRRDRATTQWVFSDRPIYAFYAGLRVPPEVAVFSKKRLRAGNLEYDALLAVLRTYKPEKVILSRFKQELKSEQKINRYITENYSKIYETDSVIFFSLKHSQ